MSQAYYQELWKETQNDVKKNLRFEEIVKKKPFYPDWNVARWLMGHLFMNYVQIANRLDKCFDQMIHPQKREVIGRLLDLALGRILELKEEIIKIELDNYCFFDDVLIELKMTHDDMEIQVPRYFWKDKEKIKEHRRALINQVFEEAAKEKFRTNYLKDFPEEAREEAWEEYLARQEQLRLEKERLEEQQKKLLGNAMKYRTSSQKLINEMNEAKAEKKPDEALSKAILLIQRHERARQGRVEATCILKYNQMKAKGTWSIKIPEEIGNKAARVIQTHWRRYRRRIQDKKQKDIVTELMGLSEPSHKETGKVNIMETIEKVRRKLRDRNQREYEQALRVIKEQVRAMYSNDMEEYLTEEIRYWFHWFYQLTDFLPNFPPKKPIIPAGETFGLPKHLDLTFIENFFPQNVKKKKDDNSLKSALAIALSGLSAIGGSALVVAGHWIVPREFLMCQEQLAKLKKIGQGADKKKVLSKEEKLELKNQMKEQERKKRWALEALGFQIKESAFVTPLRKADTDFRNDWLDIDESKNFEQRYVYKIVKDEKCCEVSMEVREIVDDVMRLELEILKDALAKDKNSRKKRKKKKASPKKQKTKNGPKDPTGDRTLDDLFLELFKNGIIRDYEEVHINDYVSERSYCAYELRRRLVDQPPSTGDVKELILELCILPLGSSRIHQLAPLIKSVCLMGPKNSGKEFLARIICTETAAVMFDLSPSNVAGKYPGKNGFKMLRHLIDKMSRALQPSVIFVDDVEKTFYKKVPKEEKNMDPRRMSKIIKKIANGIKPTDQVLLLGVCSRPWLAKRSRLLNTFQKIIFVPQMDYSSYMRVWQTMLTPQHSVPRNFDMSCLAKSSTGFSVKSIMDSVKNVITAERIGRSFIEPYKPMEFFEELLKSKATRKKSTEKCIDFFAKTNLSKKRAKKLDHLRLQAERATAESREKARYKYKVNN